MIIEPDFLDHWKTRALINLSGRAESPLWLIRLWGHCHNRKTAKFDLPPIAIAAICGVASDVSADNLFKWLKECRFIDEKKGGWEVHDWSKHNAGLVARWDNGRQPKAKRKRSETEADDKRNTGLLTFSPPDRKDRIDRKDREDRSLSGEGVSAVDREKSRTLPPRLEPFRNLWIEWVDYVCDRHRGRTPPQATFDEHLRVLAEVESSAGSAGLTESVRQAIAKAYAAPVVPKNCEQGAAPVASSSCQILPASAYPEAPSAEEPSA